MPNRTNAEHDAEVVHGEVKETRRAGGAFGQRDGIQQRRAPWPRCKECWTICATGSLCPQQQRRSSRHVEPAFDAEFHWRRRRGGRGIGGSCRADGGCAGRAVQRAVRVRRQPDRYRQRFAGHVGASAGGAVTPTAASAMARSGRRISHSPLGCPRCSRAWREAPISPTAAHRRGRRRRTR